VRELRTEEVTLGYDEATVIEGLTVEVPVGLGPLP
jgi:hypothetical protein